MRRESQNRFLTMPADRHAEVVELTEQARHQVEANWLATFAALVERQHGVWVYRKYKQPQIGLFLQNVNTFSTWR